MNERERVLDLVKKGVLSTEEALDLLEKPKTRIKSTKLQLKYPLIRQIMTFLKKLKKPTRKKKLLLMVKKNFVKMKHKIKKILKKSWTDWQLRQTKLLLN